MFCFFKKHLSDLPIRAIILGRIEFYQSKRTDQKEHVALPKSNLNQIDILLKNCDGLGISGSNENSNFSIRQFSKTKKIRAIHCAETKQSYFNF